MHVGNMTGFHAGRQEVGRCHTSGESEESIARKRGIHPGFETQGRCHPKSTTGISVALQKELVSSQIFFKKSIGKIIALQNCNFSAEENANARWETPKRQV